MCVYLRTKFQVYSRLGLTAEAQFYLTLYYNGSNSFLFVNTTKIYQFKANDSEIKKISLVFRKYFKGFHSE